MTTTNPSRIAPARSQLLLQVLGAFAVGTALTVLVVLPAEYTIDLTGFGALTGLNRVSAPIEVTVPTQVMAPPEIAKPSPVPFRTDVVTITVPPMTEQFGRLEYKVTLHKGDTMVYSWKASKPLISEFHGHTLQTEQNPTMQVMDYIKETASESNGTLTAPIDGIHGWYWAQPGYPEGMEATQVELHLAGYYTLEPGIIAME